MRKFMIAVAALSGLMLFSFQANAEQRNIIIHSGDYDSYQLGPRQGWGACKRSCDGDPRCKAWTFIRGTRQCRLKYIVGESVRNNCCVSGVKRGAATQRGSQQGFCSDYASRATESQEANLAQRCRYRGPRWNSQYAAHYQYCLRVARASANSETAARRDLLDRCRSHAGSSKKARCDHFVRIAMEQAATNRSARCGFEGPRWSGRQGRYMRRCQNQKRAVTLDDTLRREKKLRSCLSIR